jgi:hypothetical protein
LLDLRQVLRLHFHWLGIIKPSLVQAGGNLDFSFETAFIRATGL